MVSNHLVKEVTANLNTLSLRSTQQPDRDGVVYGGYRSVVLDENTTLMYYLDDNLNIGGGVKHTVGGGCSGEVRFFPLTHVQMDWIIQRESLPSGSLKDRYYSTKRRDRCYETIKATERSDPSVDLELLDSNLPPLTLTYRAWFGMRQALNDLYDRIVSVTHYDCGCPRYTHIRILGQGYTCIERQ